MQTKPLSGAAFSKIAGPSVWSAADLERDRRWLIQLEPAHVDEIRNAVECVEQAGLDFFEIDQSRFSLPTLAPVLAEVRQEILHGRGFVQMRDYPRDQEDLRRTALGYWGIAAHLGDAFVSQNAKGHVLGHVLDIGESRTNPNQRGPYSHEALPFHVDCCDIVGLLCAETARSGGESTIVSSGRLYNLILEQRPDLIGPLSEPYYRDRRGEIPPGMKPWYAIPVFNRYDGYLSSTVEPTYIGSVARHFDGREPHSDEQLEGLELLQSLAREHSFSVAFEPGDIQFLHNHTVLHSRRAFTDDRARGQRRHLVRLWLLNHDGRPLPRAYYERHGDPAEVRRPGGIVGADTVLNCPVEV